MYHYIMTSMRRDDLIDIENNISPKGVKITLQLFLGIIFFIIIYNSL